MEKTTLWQWAAFAGIALVGVYLISVVLKLVSLFPLGLIGLLILFVWYKMRA